MVTTDMLGKHLSHQLVSPPSICPKVVKTHFTGPMMGPYCSVVAMIQRMCHLHFMRLCDCVDILDIQRPRVENRDRRNHPPYAQMPKHYRYRPQLEYFQCKDATAILKYVRLPFLHSFTWVHRPFRPVRQRQEMGRSEFLTCFVLRAPSPVDVGTLRSHLC